MMKKENNLLALAAVALTAMALTACSGDIDSPAEPAGPAVPADAQESGAPIALTASMAGGQDGTRAAGTLQLSAFDAGETVRVEVTPADGSMQSSVYQASAAGEDGSNALTAYTRALTWPASGAPVSLQAFYPSTVSSSDTEFSVQTEQGDEAGYKQSDLMYATGAGGAAVTAQPKVSSIPLTFHHALSRVVVNVTPGSGMTAEGIAASTVSVYAGTKVSISSGVADPSTASEAAWITLGSGSGQAAVIVPQTIDGSAEAMEFIRVSVGETYAVYRLSKEKEFAPGKQYTYTLKVSVSGIVEMSVKENPWTYADRSLNFTEN